MKQLRKQNKHRAVLAKPDLSIIIVSYNTKELLKRCLETIIATTKVTQYEILVIDNGSTDGSIDLVKKSFPTVVLVKNTQNIGFGRANNQAAAKAKGGALFFLNSDTETHAGAIDKLYNFYKQQTGPVILGAKLYNPDGTPQSSCGPAYTLPMIFTALFLRGDHLHITRYSPNVIKEVDWVMGACMFMSRETFARIGGFDSSIFMYMEEIDFQYRAKNLGVKIFFYPNSHFTHVGAASSVGQKTPIINVFRGFLYYYRKHFNPVSVLILRMMLVLKAGTAFLIFTILRKELYKKVYMSALQVAVS